LYALSRLLVLQGRINDAITNLEQALLRDPQNGAWYFELGQLYEQRGDQSMAQAAYNKAILLDGDKAEYYRAVSKMEAKQHAKTKEAPPVAAATEVVKRHAHKFTNEAEMFLAMGDVNFEQKLYDTALEHYESALANDMTYAPSWCRVAQTKVKLGRVRDAQNDFQQALRHDAKCVDAYVGLATIAHNERNFGEALDFLRMAVTINPNAVAYQVDLAETLYALNQKEECQQTLRKMMKYLPSDAALLVRFAELAVKVAMTDDAFTTLQRAITLDDTIARAYLLIGRIYRQKSDTPKAVAAFRRAIKLSPDFKEAQHELTFAAPLSVFNRRRDLD
jgi:tetratricopeptide (TPR) repeat protein